MFKFTRQLIERLTSENERLAGELENAQTELATATTIISKLSGMKLQLISPIVEVECDITPGKSAIVTLEVSPEERVTVIDRREKVADLAEQIEDARLNGEDISNLEWRFFSAFRTPAKWLLGPKETISIVLIDPK